MVTKSVILTETEYREANLIKVKLGLTDAEIYLRGLGLPYTPRRRGKRMTLNKEDSIE